ncbi:REP-associated tyrosine transposase [Geosporobacter ferrireducens]|uniref:Transposase n=2 Tax=Geosporobacter ferrireducens TaxID=1424294 RepID=A0A1D8GG97_9FIRM|nr:transposase [Geosporobacter ferrireducens]AOT69940.1 transposase [Geosporobacter ferrireducens]MTI54364.1 transposase [Geosporobacter ferrireducens]
MPRQKRVKSESGYYHIILRGNEKRNIFHNDEDKQYFIDILESKKEGYCYSIHAFCLMDNHLHLLMNEGEEDIAKIMKRITVSYVYYFNKKYKRVGHLFQDRFRSETVEEDRYILSLTRYIHQNPVKAGLVKRPEDYKWSSYNAYIYNNNCFSNVVDTDTVLGIFSKNVKTAKTLFHKYMREENADEFIDIEEKEEVLDEEEAKALYEKMLLNWGLDSKESASADLPEAFIREFKTKTNLSIRKIAAITGMNKDKINKTLRG